MRFYTKFLGNWSVSTERKKHKKHTFESVSLASFGLKKKRDRETELQKVITFWYQRAGSS